MTDDKVHHAHGARADLWILAGLAALVGVASSGVAVVLRGGVHRLFDSLGPMRDQPLGFLLPAVGAFFAVWVIRVGFREKGSHGVSSVLEAVTRKGGYLPKRSIVSRLVGSLVNVASGGSAGLEGPTAFSAAAVGSAVGGVARVAQRQRTLLLACGVAGGIGAIFNAPLTGLIFATEVVLAEWTLVSVIPLGVSAIVATEIGRAVLGSEGAFTAGTYEWSSSDLGWSVLLGTLCGLLSVALVRAIFKVDALTRSRRRGGPWGLCMVAAGGGLLVGLVGLASPHAIGEGYGVVGEALSGLTETGPWILLGMLAAKFVATTATLGTRAPGGIFAPSLVLGALLGQAFGTLLGGGEGWGADPSFFALLAMAGCVAGAMQAPFTGIFLVLETTRGWDQVLPLVLVAVISALVSRTFLRHSFYTWNLAEEGRLLRPGTDRRILADFRVAEILDSDAPMVPEGSTLEDLAALLPETRRNHFAVLDPDGRLLGMLDITTLRGIILDPDLRRLTPVETAMDSDIPMVGEWDSLQSALNLFEESGSWVLPVVKEDGSFLGTVSKSTIFDRYRRELIVQTAPRAE